MPATTVSATFIPNITTPSTPPAISDAIGSSLHFKSKINEIVSATNNIKNVAKRATSHGFPAISTSYRGHNKKLATNMIPNRSSAKISMHPIGFLHLRHLPLSASQLTIGILSYHLNWYLHFIQCERFDLSCFFIRQTWQQANDPIIAPITNNITATNIFIYLSYHSLC